MPVLLRLADRKFVHVPEENVNELLLRGEVGFLPTDEVPIRTRDNRYFVLPAERAVKAIGRHGARYDFEAARRRTRKQQQRALEESMGVAESVLAPVIGAADMLTFGAATSAVSLGAGLAEASQSFLYDPKGAKRRGDLAADFVHNYFGTIRQQFPKYTVAGEILGSVAPLEMLGVGAKAAATTKEAIAASLLRKGSSEMKARTLSKVAGDVVQQTIEGGIIGGQAALTDIALGRTEDYTEHFVGSVGFGGVLGGGIAAGLHLPGLGAQGLKSGIGSLWERATGEKMQDWAYRKWSSAVAKTTTADEGALKFFEGPEGRRMAALAISTKTEMEDAAFKGLEIFNEGQAINKALAGATLGGMKAEAIRGLVPVENAKLAEEAIGNFLGQAGAGLKVLGDPKKGIRIKAATNLSKEIQDLNAEYQLLRNPTSKVTGPLGKSDMGGNFFLFGDRVKKVLQDRLNDLEGKIPYGNERALAAFKTADAAYKGLKSHLEDASVYAGAAAYQKEINAATTKYLGFKKFMREITKELPKEGGKGQGRTARIEAFKRMVNDSSPTALNDPGNRLRMLRDSRQAAAELAEVQAKYYTAPGTQELAKSAKSVHERSSKWFEETATRGKAIDQYKKLAGAHSPLAGVPAIARRVTNLAQWGGFGAMGLLGSGLGAMLPFTGLYVGTKVLETLVQPVRMIKLVGAIERKRALNVQRMSKTVKTTLGPLQRGEAAVIRTGEKVLIPATILKDRFVPQPVGRPRKEDETPVKLSGVYKQRLRELAILKTDPQRVGEAVWKGADQHPDLPSQFLIASQVQLHRIVDYLVDTAPKPEAGLMNETWEPDPGQLAAWTRRVETVNDPIGVLERTFAGMVTQEELDTLNVCYPSLYEEMRYTIMANLGPQDWGKIPYDLRVSVGSFLNMPTDPSLEPAFVGQMLKQYEEALVAPPPVAGLPKRDQAGRFASRSKSYASDRTALVTEKFG